MGITAGIGGLVGGLSGLFGGGNANSVQSPPMFIMPNMSQAAGSAYGAAQNLGNTYGNLGASTLPYAQNIFSSLYNNPYASQFQTGAGTAANMGTAAATGAYGAGGQLMGAGLGQLPYAQSIMQTGFDPQQALYARTAQQVQDQQQALLQQSGVGATPYGAGVAGQTMSNFNIDWQNQQLQRQAQAAAAAGGLVNQAGGAINAGAGIMNAAPGQYLSAAGMPYGTAAGIGQGQQQALQGLQGAYGGAQGIDTQNLQNWLSYLGTGNQSNQVANQLFQAQLNQNQLANQQNMQYMTMLGNSLGLLGKSGMGGFGGFGGGSTFFPSSSFLSSGMSWG